MLLVQNHIFVIMSKSLVVFHIGHKGVSWRNLWVLEVFGGFILQKFVEFIALWWVLRLASNLFHGMFLVFHSQKVLEAFLSYYGLVPL
jgi:hypothetical protein